MNSNTHSGLDQYLSSIKADWKIHYPDLEKHLQLEQLYASEWLYHEQGCIYLLLEGVLGKYKKNIPLRYVLPHEPIIILQEQSPTRFKALTHALLYKIDQQKLYELHRLYSDIAQLYHRIWLNHHQYLEYRNNLLEYRKGERLEVFRKDFQVVIPLITRKELAQYLNLSEEYLRQLF
ncbi:Crp/Fnr family transcriptional regulator [Sphingobacterium tabacisoli]|uniref:Crp/Fnr family transcriptional regulator n=1 Tax=Sphingobacterium tabacisoli TaxID=2044855 RepID=A0ABW5KW37_9SPHI|nr:Crp/Fnr family transcriptional regulator [Sphingobacterium tabacisoli]